MTIASDIVWLQKEAAWILSIDAVFFLSSGAPVDVAAIATAAPSLAIDLAVGGITDTSALINGEETIQGIYAALYGGDPTTLKKTAAKFSSIASTLQKGSADPADITWLTSAASKFIAIGNVITGYNLVDVGYLWTGLLAVANAHNDKVGAAAVTAGSNVLTGVQQALNSRGEGSGFQADGLYMQLQIIPDMKRLLPPGVLTVATGQQPVAPTGMSVPTFLFGTASIIGVGWLGLHVMRASRVKHAVPIRSRKVKR